MRDLEYGDSSTSLRRPQQRIVASRGASVLPAHTASRALPAQPPPTGSKQDGRAGEDSITRTIEHKKVQLQRRPCLHWHCRVVIPCSWHFSPLTFLTFEKSFVSLVMSLLQATLMVTSRGRCGGEQGGCAAARGDRRGGAGHTALCALEGHCWPGRGQAGTTLRCFSWGTCSRAVMQTTVVSKPRECPAEQVIGV